MDAEAADSFRKAAAVRNSGSERLRVEEGTSREQGPHGLGTLRAGAADSVRGHAYADKLKKIATCVCVCVWARACASECVRECARGWACPVCGRGGLLTRSPPEPGRAGVAGPTLKLCANGTNFPMAGRRGGQGSRDLSLALLPLGKQTRGGCPAPTGDRHDVAVVDAAGCGGDLAGTIIAVSAPGARAPCARADRGRTVRKQRRGGSAGRFACPGLVRPAA